MGDLIRRQDAIDCLSYAMPEEAPLLHSLRQYIRNVPAVLSPDPDLIEARILVSNRYDARTSGMAMQATLAGEDDDTDAVRNCLIAIKRGRELASKES